MSISAPSSVSSVMRRSSSRTPSERSSNQSPPPGRTLPRSRRPSKSPPVTGMMLRMPCGTAPSFCDGAAAILTVINGREFMAVSLLFASLKDFLDRVDRSARPAIARRDGDQSVQERILRRTGFEPQRGPKVVLGRTDGLATGESSQYFRRAVTEAEGRYVNQGAVVSLQCDPQVELESTVGTQ